MSVDFTARLAALRADILGFETRSRDHLEAATSSLAPVIQEHHDQLAKLVHGAEGTARHELKQQYRRTLNDLWERGDITRRVIQKPRGYHGDFMIMEMMYENALRGLDPLGAALHGFVVRDRSSASVRSRRSFLAEQLSSTSGGRILALASGPAREVNDALKAGTRPESVLLLDQDPEALEHSQRHLSEYETPVRYIEASAVRMDQATATVSDHGPVDLAYTAGLLDYLQDEVASAVIGFLVSATIRGGRVLVGNFSVFPIGFFADFAAGWRIVLRDETQLRALCPPDHDVETLMVGDQAFAVISKL